MDVKVIDVGSPESMMPLSYERRIIDIPVAGVTIGDHLMWLFASSSVEGEVIIRGDLWPSAELAHKVRMSHCNLRVFNSAGEEMMSVRVKDSAECEDMQLDPGSLILRYPWDILVMNERIVDGISKNRIDGEVRENVVIDGTVWVGRGSKLLPGVYIEGKVIIGENCKIGPNCYLRGNTYIGDNCHVGQAVEIKNSLLMRKVSAGHLSYLGDSVIAENTNLGAGTITANLRHDGRNHRSMVGTELVDSGRRKFGTIIGAHVHTGIHTTIYPGRKIWPGFATLPGQVISKDLTNS